MQSSARWQPGSGFVGCLERHPDSSCHPHTVFDHCRLGSRRRWRHPQDPAAHRTADSTTVAVLRTARSSTLRTHAPPHRIVSATFATGSVGRSQPASQSLLVSSPQRLLSRSQTARPDTESRSVGCSGNDCRHRRTCPGTHHHCGPVTPAVGANLSVAQFPSSTQPSTHVPGIPWAPLTVPTCAAPVEFKHWPTQSPLEQTLFTGHSASTRTLRAAVVHVADRGALIVTRQPGAHRLSPLQNWSVKPCRLTAGMH